MTAILENLNYRFDVVDAQLAHAKRGPLGAAYDRTQYFTERKQMMQDWADYVDRLAKEIKIEEHKIPERVKSVKMLQVG